MNLTTHEQEVCLKVRDRLLYPLESFTVITMWPTVKRARYIFDRLEEKGILESSFVLGTGEKHWHFTDKAKEILDERW